MKFRDFHKSSGVASIRDARAADTKVPPAKEYPRLPRLMLPQPQLPPAMLGETLRDRASFRDFTDATISLQALGDMLFFSGGVADERRHYPSGGALYPIEMYVAAYRVADLSPALYHYYGHSHALEKLPASPLDIWESCKELVPATQPAAIIILTAVWDRSYMKYGDFAYRLALMEAGHCMQNIALVATAEGVKQCPVAGFSEQLASRCIGIDKDAEDPLYMSLVGL